jgi:hypothetical protein
LGYIQNNSEIPARLNLVLLNARNSVFSVIGHWYQSKIPDNFVRSETGGIFPTEKLRGSLRVPTMNTLFESAEILIICGQTFPEEISGLFGGSGQRREWFGGLEVA